MTDSSASSSRWSISMGPILVILVVAGVVVALAALSSSTFLTLNNMFVVLRAASITGIVAVGMSYVTISGNLFALSAGQLSALLCVLFALMVKAGLGVPTSVLLTCGAAVVAGVVQGYAISLIRNPIIATIAFGAVFAGLAAFISGNGNIRIHDETALWLGTLRPLAIPIQSWVFVVWAILGLLIMNYTRVGRLITLNGSNPEAAAATGMSVRFAAAVALALLGLSCAIVAVFSVSQFSQAKADMFGGLDIDAIASVLVGGVALRGGWGSPVQAAFGAVLIALLQNYLLLMSLSAGVRLAIVGALVIVATSGFHLAQRSSR